MPHLSTKKGFTLIELMVVISIIGLLSSIILAGLSKAKQGARDAVRASDYHTLHTAILSYSFDHNAYPPTANTTAGDDYSISGSAPGSFIPVLVTEKYIGKEIIAPSLPGGVGIYEYMNRDTCTGSSCTLIAAKIDSVCGFTRLAKAVLVIFFEGTPQLRTGNTYAGQPAQCYFNN